MPDVLRVLIADDHPLFRDGLRMLLSTADHVILVGEASNGEEAVRLAGETRPDVILMDVQMPVLNGVEATRQVLHSLPTVGILVLTMFDDDPAVFAAMRAGARGFLLKGAKHEDLLRAVQCVGRGEAIFSPSIAARMTQYFNHMSANGALQAFPELSDREREVLALLAQGLRNALIAKRLGVTEKTVRNHISNIFAKLQVASRAQAMLLAREAGLGLSE